MTPEQWSSHVWMMMVASHGVLISCGKDRDEAFAKLVREYYGALTSLGTCPEWLDDEFKRIGR